MKIINISKTENMSFRSSIAAKMDISKDRIVEYIYQLRDARLPNVLAAEGKGVSRLQKPDKLFLENTNLSYAIHPERNQGNVRETFLLNQLLNAGKSSHTSVIGLP